MPPVWPYRVALSRLLPPLIDIILPDDITPKRKTRNFYYMDIRQLMRFARGDEPADLLFTNARIVNVFTGEIVGDNFAVKNGIILGVGDYSARTVLDMKHRFVAPGFVDAHVHIESAMIGVSEFARLILGRGTTTVVADPHEIANVMGKTGVDYMLRSAEDQPMDIYYTVPSCVPATRMETAGAEVSAADIAALMASSRVVGLAEMMNFPGVIYEDEVVWEKIQVAKAKGKLVDGHSPGLSGNHLNAYIGSGIGSDHECVTAREAMEKLAAGMVVMVREGTGAKNLKDLLPVINSKTSRRMMWCTDDRHPNDLMEKGHIDDVVRKAIGYGLDPVTAIQMATINPAQYFGLHDIGAVAPGRKANFVVFRDLNRPVVEQVYVKGIRVAENGHVLSKVHRPRTLPVSNTMNVDMAHCKFEIPAASPRIHLIEMIENQIVTKHRIADIHISGGLAVSDVSRDILKCVVIERHKHSGNIGKGFVKGFGLKRGALASSVAHDSHNIIVVGTNDGDMKAAAKKVVEMKGGMAVASGGKIDESLALPIAGLMSTEPVGPVCRQVDRLMSAAGHLGSQLEDPFMALSFMALPVIPEIKITDLGLVDVEAFQIIPLFVT